MKQCKVIYVNCYNCDRIQALEKAINPYLAHGYEIKAVQDFHGCDGFYIFFEKNI